jgi:hypothetical protein
VPHASSPPLKAPDENKAQPTPLIAILAIINDARVTRRLEATIKDYAKIRSIHYLTEEDKNGWPQIRIAIYMVEAMNPRLLRSSLRNIENNRDCEIIIR